MTPDGCDPQTTVDEVLVDARALQERGTLPSWAIDRAADLLAAIRHRDWPRSRPTVVGLVDHAAAPLSERHRLFFDEVATSRLRPGRRSRWFVSVAPMSHDPVWAMPILLDPQVFKVASLPEPISIDPEGGTPIRFARRADHLTRLAWLGRYDAFAVRTRRAKADLERARSIEPSRIVVGADLRDGSRASPGDTVPFSRRRHVAVMLRGAKRDEVAAILAAHARARGRLRLVLIGDCSPEVRGEVRSAYVREGGSPDALDFVEAADDGPLGNLLSEALLTVFPSPDGRAFSSYALGSMGLGTPVVVCGGDQADVDAISALDCPRADRGALARVFDAMSGDVALWERASLAALDEGGCKASQAEARFLLDALVARARGRAPAPAVGRDLRPRLAVVAALPPLSEGAARTMVAVEALARRFEVHAFSDTPGAAPGGAVRSLAPVRSFELHPQRFDASLSVLGNSRRHAGSFHHVLENGGAALVHDAHLVGFYADAFGLDRTLALGRAEYGRDFTEKQILRWTREQHGLLTLFLSEVTRAAAPLLVTSEAAYDAVAHRYAVEPRRLPALQHRSFDRGLLSPAKRDSLREAFGWRREAVTLISLDLDASAASVALWALRLLRDWRIDGHLVLCGGAGRAEIDRLVRELDLGGAVAFPGEDAPEQVRSGWLAAADIAVQLGTYPLAGPSGALMACIAAALPTVSNDHVARAAEAPAFVRRVPDALSPVLVAEAALEIVSSGQHRLRPIDEARAFGADHSPDRYARALAEALGLDAGPA